MIKGSTKYRSTTYGIAKIKRFTAIGVLIFTIVLGVIGVPKPILAQSSETSLKAVNKSDIWAKTLSGSHFTESWTYQCYFENGVSLYAVFSVSNLGALKASVSGVQVSLYNFEGNDYQISREYPLKQLSQDSVLDFSFNLNPRQDNIWFKGELPVQHELYINTDKDGNRFNIKLSFSQIASAVRVESPIFSSIDQDAGFIAHIPFAEVSGIVGIDNDSMQVKGKAYMDHTWLAAKSSDHYKAIYRFVTLENRDDWGFTYALFPGKTDNLNNNVVGFNLDSKQSKVRHNSITASEKTVTVVTKENQTPNKLDLVGADKAPFSIVNKQEVGTYAMFEDVGWLAKRALKRIAGGELVYYRGKGEIYLDENPKTKRMGFYHYLLIK